MASRKQRRRQQKLKRHEYEEVYVDEEGRELAPEEAEELVGTTQPARQSRANAKPQQRGGRGGTSNHRRSSAPRSAASSSSP